MTVKELKEAIENLPDDAIVYYQRIEDVYFEKHNWNVVKKEGEHYHSLMDWNRDIDSGKYLDDEQYPDIKPENLLKATEKDLEESKEQYIKAFCAVKYGNDNNLYIDAHY
jgi:hypothetical protein